VIDPDRGASLAPTLRQEFAPGLAKLAGGDKAVEGLAGEAPLVFCRSRGQRLAGERARLVCLPPGIQKLLEKTGRGEGEQAVRHRYHPVPARPGRRPHRPGRQRRPHRKYAELNPARLCRDDDHDPAALTMRRLSVPVSMVRTRVRSAIRSASYFDLKNPLG